MPVEMLTENMEALSRVAQSMLTGNPRASMKVIYARRPHKDHKGKALQNAGWITWIDNDTQTGAIWQKMAAGWVPLEQFGTIGTRDGANDPLGPWQKILEHPDGPKMFPVDQLLEQGWFDPERVPVAGVKFPQLKGMKIPLYPCPECSDRSFLKPIHLARHCRNAHSYDRKDIQDLADQLGIDLVKEMYGGRDKLHVYDYSEDDAEAEAVVPPEYEVEAVAVQPRSAAKPAKKANNQWTPERRAEASRKAKERAALRA